jgi:hypothetical protein
VQVIRPRKAFNAILSQKAMDFEKQLDAVLAEARKRGKRKKRPASGTVLPE